MCHELIGGLLSALSNLLIGGLFDQAINLGIYGVIVASSVDDIVKWLVD